MLPLEIIRYILLWEGSLKERNGKWMGQIQIPNEIRENLQRCISRKKKAILRYMKMIAWSVIIPDTGKRINVLIYETGLHYFYMTDHFDPKSQYGNTPIESYYF